MENHTQKPLEFGQTWINLETTRKEIPSGKALVTGGLGGTFRSIKTLPPGRHRFYGDAFESASANLGLPPVTGLRVEVQAKVDTEIKGGKRYKTPPKDEPSFTFEWRYPSAAERTGMIQEMKQYLAAPGDLEKNCSRMSALFELPQIQESLTAQDYLPALKASRLTGLRHLLVSNLFARYSDDPRVLAYYREAFQKEPDVVYWDAAISVWNEEFLEPLVQGCEKDKWHYFSVLSRHSAEWRNRPPYVARISTALLKHNPILRREVRKIPDKELEQWAKAVLEAGDVADPALVELLKPALKDQRPARIDRGAGGLNEGRVCDRALMAILQILDGDSWKAFEDAGITEWSTEKEGLEAYDRVIGILTERLKLPPIKK